MSVVHRRNDSDRAGGYYYYGLEVLQGEGECQRFYRDLCEITQGDSIESERLAFDEEEFESCASKSIEDAEDCNAAGFYVGDYFAGACTGTQYLTGNVDDGDLCYQESECADEKASCKLKESSDDDVHLVTAEGKCVLPNVGDSCDYEEQCPDTAYCDYDTYVCTLYKGIDDECDSAYQCASGWCDYDNDADEYLCRAKLANGAECNYGDCLGWCDESTDPGQCVSKKSGGQPCEEDRECELYCEGGECIAEGDDVEYEYDICTGSDE